MCCIEITYHAYTALDPGAKRGKKDKQVVVRAPMTHQNSPPNQSNIFLLNKHVKILLEISATTNHVFTQYNYCVLLVLPWPEGFDPNSGQSLSHYSPPSPANQHFMGMPGFNIFTLLETKCKQKAGRVRHL